MVRDKPPPEPPTESHLAPASKECGGGGGAVGVNSVGGGLSSYERWQCQCQSSAQREFYWYLFPPVPFFCRFGVYCGQPLELTAMR